jgi:hypothetical protein
VARFGFHLHFLKKKRHLQLAEENRLLAVEGRPLSVLPFGELL